MRTLIYLLAALQIGMFVYFSLGLGPTTTLSEMMQVEGFTSLTGMALAICLVPALILAVTGRFLGVALAAALVPLTALALFSYNL